jgi:hypothetical protein
MDPHAQSGMAAEECAECERSCQKVLAKCSWCRSKPPPLPRESPPRSSKSVARENIAKQLERVPPEDCASFVPVSAVVVDNKFAAMAHMVDPSRRGEDSLESSGNESLKSPSPLHPASLSSSAFKSPNGDINNTKQVPSNFEELTNAQVAKQSFHERLIHYMDGKKISRLNRKAVKFAILFEAGTYVRNLNPMRKVQQGEILLSKYKSLILDIEDRYFLCETFLDGMLKGYKGAKKQLTGETLWQKMEKEMTQVKTFASKFPGINCPSKPRLEIPIFGSNFWDPH